MATYVTTSPIQVTQLGAELGAAITVTNEDGLRTIVCEDDTVTLGALEAAVLAHVAEPPPPPATPAYITDVRAVQAQVDELTDLVLEGLF